MRRLAPHTSRWQAYLVQAHRCRQGFLRSCVCVCVCVCVRARVRAFVLQELEAGIKPRRIIVGGFSMGGSMALHLLSGLRVQALQFRLVVEFRVGV